MGIITILVIMYITISIWYTIGYVYSIVTIIVIIGSSATYNTC